MHFYLNILESNNNRLGCLWALPLDASASRCVTTDIRHGIRFAFGCSAWTDAASCFCRSLLEGVMRGIITCFLFSRHFGTFGLGKRAWMTSSARSIGSVQVCVTNSSSWLWMPVVNLCSTAGHDSEEHCRWWLLEAVKHAENVHFQKCFSMFWQFKINSLYLHIRICYPGRPPFWQWGTRMSWAPKFCASSLAVTSASFRQPKIGCVQLPSFINVSPTGAWQLSHQSRTRLWCVDKSFVELRRQVTLIVDPW